MAQALLIRSGTTLYDEQNRVQGILDVPLSERGRAEAARLAESLPAACDAAPSAALYCGPGESVVRTAEIVGKALGLRPQTDRRPAEPRPGAVAGAPARGDQAAKHEAFPPVDRRSHDHLSAPGRDRRGCDGTGQRRRSSPCSAAIRRRAFGLVVGEPLARLVSCYLRRDPRPQLDEQLPCCGFERIDDPPRAARQRLLLTIHPKYTTVWAPVALTEDPGTPRPRLVAEIAQGGVDPWPRKLGHR